MRAKITTFLFGITAAFCLSAISGCSGERAESTVELYKDVEQLSDNSGSTVISENPESSAGNPDSSTENSHFDIAPNTQSAPDGKPTVFIGPDGEPIYDSDVTKIINYYDKDFGKNAAEITEEDEGAQIVCKGFQYFRVPLKTLFEQKRAEHIVCCVKPPCKASSLASSAFLAADALHPFLLFKPVFRDTL